MTTSTISEAYAEERIQEKLDLFERERPKLALRLLDEHLRDDGVSANVRLHYITALFHLGRLSAESLYERLDDVD